MLRLDRSKPLDAIVIGRAGMDLYPVPDGTKTEAAAAFQSDVGGSAANIAVSLARQGGRVGLLSCLSDDPVGKYVHRTLERYGVDLSRCRTITGQYRTSLALAETRQTDCEVVIYRNGAADLGLSPADVQTADLESAACVIVTGTALAQEPSRSAVFEALRICGKAGVVRILDLDYRPYSWPSAADARTTYGHAAAKSDVVIGNDDEFAVLGDPAAEPLATATTLAENGAGLVVFKKGEAGSTAFAEDKVVETPIYPVPIKKPFGAGDAFMGGLVFALLEGRTVGVALARGSAAAALVVSRPGCASAMPTPSEIDAIVTGEI